jgi:hypothetical protein
MSRLEIEGEALRMATPLLSGDGDFGDDNAPASTRWTAPTRPVQVVVWVGRAEPSNCTIMERRRSAIGQTFAALGGRIL